MSKNSNTTILSQEQMSSLMSSLFPTEYLTGRGHQMTRYDFDVIYEEEVSTIHQFYADLLEEQKHWDAAKPVVPPSSDEEDFGEDVGC